MEPTLIQQLSEAQATIAALTTERDTFRAQAETAATLAENLKAEKAQVEADAAKAKADAEKAASDSAALLAAETAARAEIEKAQASTVAELDKAKRALANPAFVDAAMTGTQPVADSGNMEKKSMPRAEFDKLSPEAKDRFIAGRGTITA